MMTHAPERLASILVHRWPCVVEETPEGLRVTRAPRPLESRRCAVLFVGPSAVLVNMGDPAEPIEGRRCRWFYFGTGTPEAPELREWVLDRQDADLLRQCYRPPCYRPGVVS